MCTLVEIHDFFLFPCFISVTPLCLLFASRKLSMSSNLSLCTQVVVAFNISLITPHQTEPNESDSVLTCFQVVSNYISNAVKFTPRGGKVKLRIQCNTSDSPEMLVGLQQPLLAGSTCTCPNHANFVSVTISVEDSGIGISKDDQARLFEPYMQISAGSLQGGGGTGLGLCFAKR